jgi:hypothetical protein
VAGDAIVVGITSEGSSLNVNIDVHAPEKTRIQARFEGLVGYRVLDERDLPQFWHSAKNVGALEGCMLYEVTSGGWFEEHKAQSPIMAAGFYPQLREWLLLSEDWCVSVLSEACNEPRLTTR